MGPIKENRKSPMIIISPIIESLERKNRLITRRVGLSALTLSAMETSSTASVPAVSFTVSSAEEIFSFSSFSVSFISSTSLRDFNAGINHHIHNVRKENT